MNNETLFKQWVKEFYDKYAETPEVSDCDFESIAIGFFVAKGLNVIQAQETYQYCIDNGKW